jgi:hypothetical protein
LLIVVALFLEQNYLFIDNVYLANVLPKVYCHIVLMSLLQLKFYYLAAAGNTIKAVCSVVKWGRQGIHIVHSKHQFPSKLSLANVTFLTADLFLLLSEQLRMALVR